MKLGDKVKDPITGYVGIAYAKTTYLQGCDRISIQAPMYKDKDGVPCVPDLFSVDEPQLIVITSAKKSPIKKTQAGGPSKFESLNR